MKSMISSKGRWDQPGGADPSEDPGPCWLSAPHLLRAPNGGREWSRDQEDNNPPAIHLHTHTK